MYSRVKAVQKLSSLVDTTGKGSWHDEYRDSPYIYIGGLPYELTEGDIRTVFSQYGQVTEVNLIRDKETNKSKGFSFLKYLDQRSTVLAVDNFNGISISGRTIQVDHVTKYKTEEELEAEKAAKRPKKINYAELVTEELFKQASNDLAVAPNIRHIQSSAMESPDILLEAEHGEAHAKDEKIKRPRTQAEIELRKLFLDGQISQAEYLTQKSGLKRNIKKRN